MNGPTMKEVYPLGEPMIIQIKFQGDVPDHLTSSLHQVKYILQLHEKCLRGGHHLETMKSRQCVEAVSF